MFNDNRWSKCNAVKLLFGIKGKMNFEKLKNDPRLPRHIAFIIDGNGRWAKKRFLPRKAGHKAGAEALERIIEDCRDLGVKHLTVYAFSTENWKRSSEEVGALMQLFRYYMDHPELLPNEYVERMWQSGETQERSVCDYISGMTDQYAIAKFQEFFIPASWRY